MVAQFAEDMALDTRSGLRLAVRRACHYDEAAIRRLFEHVSADDRRFRFLSASEHVSDDQIAAMTDADPWFTDSFLAFAGEELVACAVLACDRGMEMGEVAISIRADRKGQGIGWSLLQLLRGEARRRGVRRLLSVEARENHQAITLEREMGFVARDVEGDPGVVLLEARL